jgi:hypothetical protein
VPQWCGLHGVTVGRSGDSDADRVIGGRPVGIKRSGLWESGIYKLQHIRDQEYDYVIRLRLSPFDAHDRANPTKVIRQHTPPEHEGKRGKDTRWLSFPASDPPAWLGQYWGDSAKAIGIIKGLAE